MQQTRETASENNNLKNAISLEQRTDTNELLAKFLDKINKLETREKNNHQGQVTSRGPPSGASQKALYARKKLAPL